jgi:L-seryl-tRNA(Ser) seleniumtransferase
MSTARRLPAVHALLATPALADAVGRHGVSLVTDAARAVLAEARAAAVAGEPAPASDELTASVLARLSQWTAPRPRRVINATGVILHTNLGRAPVSQAAAAAMAEASAGYTDLEYDLAAGERGSRHDLAASLLCRLTGAEAALVVNNNAGATLLVLSALARDRGVVVSRGQLVEIGGGYRIPTVMAAGGARLVEVGTTNRTYLHDYRAALDETIALLLRVHTSNYRLVGFTQTVDLMDLVALGREAGLPIVDDLGSGSLLDTTDFGLAREPLVQESIAAGAALVTFSGDKLLGGPQAGIIVGRAGLIERLRRHPLTRAMRVDKLQVAALGATLALYAKGEHGSVPVHRMIHEGADLLSKRAHRLSEAIGGDLEGAHVVRTESVVGGGSLPGLALAGWGVRVKVPDPNAFAHRLRAGHPSVFCRVAEDHVVLDVRTMTDDEVPRAARAVLYALEGDDFDDD